MTITEILKENVVMVKASINPSFADLESLWISFEMAKKRNPKVYTIVGKDILNRLWIEGFDIHSFGKVSCVEK